MTELVIGAAPAQGHCLTLAKMRAALEVDYAGFDLTKEQEDLLLNEGHGEMVARAEWLRGAITLTGSAGVYAVPAGVARIRSVAATGQPLDQVDGTVGLELLNGTASQSGAPVWWGAVDATGKIESVHIFPSPPASPVVAQVALYPPEMVADDDEPSVPCEYRRSIVSYAAAQVYGSVEDDRDLRDANMSDFELAVNRLRVHRITRFGAGTVQMRVAA